MAAGDATIVEAAMAGEAGGSGGMLALLRAREVLQDEVVRLRAELSEHERVAAKKASDAAAREVSYEMMLRELTVTMRAEVGRAGRLQEAHDEAVEKLRSELAQVRA